MRPSLFPRHVEVKVLDPTNGTLLFRSEQAAAVRPGGENVVLTLCMIPDVQANVGQNLGVILVDPDNEEILERKTVSLKVQLDEWF